LFGVQGKPSFWKLQTKLGSSFFDVYTNFTIDVMHSIFLGVVLWTTEIWFSLSVCMISGRYFTIVEARMRFWTKTKY